MFSLSWHRTSSRPTVNFSLFLFCLTCISFLLGVNCFAAFVSSYPFCLLSPLHNHHFTLNDELVICSLNVRGLSNPLKRRETFRWLKVLLRRKFLFLFPSFFNINLLYMFKIIQIAKNWNDTCVRGLEISH